jgi:sugar/nucleoside kinase (ribokinase family)
MTRVVCLGDVMIDVLARLPAALAVGSDTPAGIGILSGGSAANTAAWLVAAGARAAFVGRVGDDLLGRKAVDELAAAGVELDVTVDPVLPTGTCIVLVDPSGERTMVPDAGANATGGELPELEASDHLHVSGYALFHPASRDTAVAALARARDLGCTVSVDAASSAPLRSFGREAFLSAVGSVLVFANRDEATALTGEREAAAAARLLGARCGEAIVKCGGDGAVWSDGASVVRSSCRPVRIVDSTGAGDAFAAGVLAARRAGAPVADALRAGNELAARAIAKPGARP